MTNESKRSSRGSLLILLMTSLLSLGAAEWVARLLPKNYYEWQHRYMFLSEDVVTNKTFADGSSAQWYKPDQAINWAVFYGYPWQRPKQEYSIWSTTNNIGLVQAGDFEPGKDSIAIFGDSFTEPQATTPWFYALENHWKRLDPEQKNQLLNFGYQGTGIGRWDQISKNLSESLNITKAVYVAIGQDVARLGRSGWNDRDLACLSDARLCKKNHYYQAIAGDEQDSAALEQRTQLLMAKRNSTLDKQLRYGLCGISELVRQVASVIGSPCFDGKPPTNYQQDLKVAVGHGLAHFKDQIERYGKNNVALVWIPERNEAATGTISPISKKVLRVAKALLPKNHVIRCELGSNDYYNKDGHQNEAGSRKIYSCVAQALAQTNASHGASEDGVNEGGHHRTLSKDNQGAH